jgi:hypothetical protein
MVVSTNDPSKTMFGQSPFRAMDDNDAEPAEPQAPAAPASPAVARSKASLFFDEDGWDVPEERISGSFAVAREGGSLNTSEVAESLGLEDVPQATLVEETEIERPFSGTMRFRPEDLAGLGADAEHEDEVIQPGAEAVEESVATAPVGADEPAVAARPFGGTMMFSAQDIVGAFDDEADDETRGLRPYEQDVRRATTQENAGIDKRPDGERQFSGTMRFRREELAEMGSGNKATTEVDLRALAYTTGASQVVENEVVEPDADEASAGSDQPHVGLPATETTSEEAAEPISNRTMMGVSPFFVGAEANEPVAEVTPAVPADLAGDSGEESTEETAAEAAGEAESATSEEVDRGADVDTAAADVAVASEENAEEQAHESDTPTAEADANASDSSDASPVDGPAAAPDQAGVEAAPVPVVEDDVRRAPAVTQPTQLMPALTMPQTIAGETDALLGASKLPASTPSTPSKEESSGSPVAMIAVVVLIALVVLVLAAMLVLR